MLISHEYFDHPFNPEAVLGVTVHKDATGLARHVLRLHFEASFCLDSKILIEEKQENLDQIERDINRACLDIGNDEMKKIGEEIEKEYDGSEPLPEPIKYNVTLSDKKGLLYNGYFITGEILHMDFDGKVSARHLNKLIIKPVKKLDG